ncbi:MAG TPA: hypothetical protein VGF28_22340 [Thermoanaerobaculia bacterium]|jgi:hypothetical protein
MFHTLMRLRGLVVFLILSLGCSRKVKDYPVPRAAQKLDGMVCVTLRHGDGPPAMSGGIWGVESRLMSHTEQGCAYPCKRYLLYPRLSQQLEPWNGVVRTMREGEVRRVWLTLPQHNEPRVYDIELASVVRTDSAGEPIIENR